ncbi:MAG: Ppx/GppA family phosphatase [Myxococcota bacterium]
MNAVIDIGSNSVLMLVAERDEHGRVHVVEDYAEISRLSEGVAETGRLKPEAIERTVAVLERHRHRAEAHGARLQAVATEGLRLAKDPQVFLDRAEQALGQPIRLISGDEEATLSYRSVADEAQAGTLRVIDIGGASTELVAGHGSTIEGRKSHRIGSVRLTERFVDSDPPTAAALHAIESAARQALATQPLDPHPELHGLAGTVTTAAALILDLQDYDRGVVDGSRFSIERVRDLRDRLARQTTAQRMASPMLPAGRADVIVTGVTILLVAMEHCGAQTLVVRDRGLRYALI